MNEPGADNGLKEETVTPVRRTEIPDFAASATAGRGGLTRVVMALGFVAVIIGLLMVFVYLPDQVAERESESEVVAEEVAEPAEPVEPPLTRRQVEELRAEAEDLLAQLLEQRDELETRSAASWGGELWESYRASARQGDDALLAGDVREAVDRYQEAVGHGENLFRQSQDIMTNAMAAGEAALEAGNAEVAAAQFGLVLAVDADNAGALEGQQRAESLPAVLDAMRRGDQYRLDGDLEAAADAYREALALDRDWTPASEALAGMTSAIADLRFNALLSDGYRALDEGRFDAAIETFNAAILMRSGSDAARDGLAQAEEGQVRNAVVMAEVRGMAFERREMWDQAMDRYREALEVDPSLSFALEGLDRAQYRADLEAKLNSLIDSPSLLLGDEVLAESREILAEARGIAEPGPRHTAQADRLEELIEIASTPISITLLSDNATEVTVYRVGELGAFESRQLDLRPGQYTAIGARRGFRDVRRTFTVLPGRSNAPVTIICEEQI